MDKVIALIGANGMLASMIQGKQQTGYRIVPFDLPEFDLTDEGQVRRVLSELTPNIIINCAAYTNVDGCETQQQIAMQVNGDGPGYLAAVARDIDAVLLHISTDFVFDGTKRTPYVETDPTGPLSIYGASKLRGEQQVLESGLKNYFIVRTSWLYGPGGHNFVETILRLATEREELRIVSDQVGTPTYTGDLTNAVFSLLETNDFGIYHFSNTGQCSWYDFAEEIVHQSRVLGYELRVRQIEPIMTEDYPLPARRPACSMFSKAKLVSATDMVVPDWKSSLQVYLQSRTK